MTVEELIVKLKGLKKSLQDKEIVLKCPNGVLVPPEIKLELKNEEEFLNHSTDNIEKIVLSY